MFIFFSSLKQQLWSNISVFRNSLLAASDWKFLWLQIHLIGVTTDMAVHTHRTLYPDLFSWNGIVCPRCVFTQFWNFRETNLYETGNWSQMAKVVLPPLKAGYLQSQNTRKKKARFIYLFITTTALVNNLNFLKETRWLPFLAGKSSGSSFT